MKPEATAPASEPASISPPKPAPASVRVASVDAYRGLVMFLMMAEVLSLGAVAGAHAGSKFWQFLAHHQSHVEWVGCSLHDLIQPSFSFLVGVALPFSIANRLAKGQSRVRMNLHAFWRALLLILLGVFLRSIHSNQTNWTFEDTLTQIGLGYGFLFFLGFRCPRDQWIALGVLLVGYWAAFALYPLPGPDFNYAAVGVPADWGHLFNGFQAHWNKNSNLAWAFDTWFLNLFPRPERFQYNGGGYATLSFVPTLGTMILGLIAGGVLAKESPGLTKARWFATAGIICLVFGAALGLLGVCPVVKRIWTPAWTIFSGGWCFLFLAGFYLLVDLWGKKGWVFPLIVVGMNSIAAYCIAHLFDTFIHKNLVTHLGSGVFKIFGPGYEPLLHGAATLLVMWLILWWMYKRKLFLRI
jgi:predicted acyltransferase